MEEKDMSSRTEAAFAHFDSGFNCAQSVLAVFCEKYGVDKDIAFKACSGLGAGFRLGEVCGAVSGAVLVIGLKYGQNTPGDKISKDNCNAKVIEFMEKFKNKNGSIVCREILGFDLSIKEEYEEAQSQNLFKTRCVDMVKNSVTLLEELGY